jgi:hypothetical protein
MKHNRRINRRIIILGFITISLLLCTGAFCEMTFAQGGEQAVSQALSSYGLNKIDVSFSENSILVKYIQPLAEFKTLDEEAIRVAEITRIVSSRLSTEKNVCIHQHFDDGQVIELTIEPKDARRFLNGQLTTEAFLDKAEMKPLTRGSPIVPGRCEPEKGKSCKNYEACTCYPNEVCAPENPQANEKGCVEKYAPSNAHLLGSEYVCNKGYEWNSELTECVQAAGSLSTPTAGKPKGSTTWGSLSAGSAGSTIGQAFLLDSIPPTSQSRKNVFSPGERIYLWAESKILNAPHKLEVAWINPSGKEVKRETFDLRGWGARETFWSELQTGRHMEGGQWKVKLLIDGRVDRALYWHLKP